MKKGTTKALHTSEVGLTKPGPAVIPKVRSFVCFLCCCFWGFFCLQAAAAAAAGGGGGFV